jgi:putative tryptophan/tyrosine transport system substrate-binding protein
MRHQATGNSKKVKVIGVVLSAVLFALCLRAQAEQPTRIAKIGWLSARPGLTEAQKIIVRMLGDLGYVSGKNVTFEFRYADNKLDRFPALAEDLVRLKVDVLVTPGTAGALALKNATKTIPIVFLDVTDPVATGLVDSLARPGGNATGFSSIEADLAGKRLELIKEAVPGISRIAVLWNPNDPSSQQQWKESQKPAQKLGLQLYSLEVSSADKLENSFKKATQVRSAALFVISNALAASNQKRLADLAAKYRLPAVYPQINFVISGGLISYGPDQTERYRRVAAMIDKILNGSKPTELPVEQPTKFELVINLKAAKQIGLTIPQSVLYQADKVIK